MTVDYSSETMETRRKQKIFPKYRILKGVLLFVSCERPYAENDYRLEKNSCKPGICHFFPQEFKPFREADLIVGFHIKWKELEHCSWSY